MKAANSCVFQSYGVILLTYLRGPMTSLTWGPVGHCTSGRPLNPPLQTHRGQNASFDNRWPCFRRCCTGRLEQPARRRTDINIAAAVPTSAEVW